MSEVKKCPKCGGEMVLGFLSADERSHLSAKESLRLQTELKTRLVRLFIGGWILRKPISTAIGIVPFHCESCGYVELYKKMKENKKQGPE